MGDASLKKSSRSHLLTMGFRLISLMPIVLCSAPGDAFVATSIISPISLHKTRTTTFSSSSKRVDSLSRRKTLRERRGVVTSSSSSSPSPSIIQRAMSSNNNSNNDDDRELPPSGSFFNEVPPPKEDDANSSLNNPNDIDEIGIYSFASNLSLPNLPLLGEGDGADMFKRIIQNTKLSSGGGFATTTTTSITEQTMASIIKDSNNSSFVGIGKRLNDVRNPEYDENGYTLYADETTGVKRRVFEALVDYPSVFKVKIIGRDEFDEAKFAPEMVNLVARSCGVDASMVHHTERKAGKWTSVTIHAPVRDADMLYELYANVSDDPRVKFKF